MQRLKFCAVAAIVAMMVAGSPAAANQFANPSFEDPITSDGPPFVGSWEGFSGNFGGGSSSSSNSSVMPRTGAGHVNLTITSGSGFAGVFQDVPGLTPGTPVIFSGWHQSTSLPVDITSEVRIEWRNSVSNTEVSRTPNLLPVASAAYSPFALPVLVPAGADTARAVYAVETFFGPMDPPQNGGTVFIDDFSFIVIPEPAAVTLLVLGCLGLAGLRRRPS
jgi:hypothetical protein